MQRIGASDAKRLRQLNDQLDSRLIRTVLTPEGKRIMPQTRMDRLMRGTGKLSADEREKLNRLSNNARAVGQLSKRKTIGNGHTRLSTRTHKNRSIRDWVLHGKERDAPRPDDKEGKIDEQKAIHGLRFLGVDPSEKTYYLRKVRT